MAKSITYADNEDYYAITGESCRVVIPDLEQSDGAVTVDLSKALERMRKPPKIWQLQVDVRAGDGSLATPAGGTFQPALRSPGAAGYVNTSNNMDMTDSPVMATLGVEVADSIKGTPTKFDADHTYDLIINGRIE